MNNGNKKTTIYDDVKPAFTKAGLCILSYLIFSIQPMFYGSLQVTFEGKVGKNYQSDISIDDFSLSPGGCTGGSVSSFGDASFVCGLSSLCFADTMFFSRPGEQVLPYIRYTSISHPSGMGLIRFGLKTGKDLNHFGPNLKSIRIWN